MNGKAFRVLSDTLYQNKIASIVRELSCNAYDSHVMAGKQHIPFTLHLPDAFEPWFSVQDQGVGLSDSDISSVFTVYFQSTKEQSNDTIGAFGLGAKTPFSYTDQFTVTSVKNGTRNIYNAFINDQGIPNIVKMFSEETTEDNGVEIKLSVKREDYSKFNNEVLDQLRYFKTKPVLQNSSNIEFPKQKDHSFDTSNITISSLVYSEHSIVALQGNVGYNLDINQLRDKIDQSNMQFLKNILRQNKVLLKFTIGEIGVTASREGVEYTNTTVANICAKITKCRSELQQIITAKLANDFVTDYDRLAYLNSEYSARILSPAMVIPNCQIGTDGKYVFNLSKVLFCTTTQKVIGDITYHLRDNKFRRGVSSSVVNAFTVRPQEEVMFVFKDKSSLYNKKIQHLFQINPNLKQVFCIEMYNKVYSKQQVNDIQKYLVGFTNICMLSNVELPADVQEQRKRQQQSIPKYYQYSSSNCYSYSDTRMYTKVFEDLSKISTKTVYFVVENLSPVNVGSNLSLLQDLSTFSTVLPVIAVRQSAVEKIEKNPLFIPLSTYIKETKQSLISDEVKREINRKFIVDTLSSNISYNIHNKKDVIKKHCPDNEIARLFSALDKQKEKSTKTYSSSFKNFIEYRPESSPVVRAKINKLNDFVHKLIKKYAVLNTIGNTYGRGEISDDHLILYLNAVQSYTQKQSV